MLADRRSKGCLFDDAAVAAVAQAVGLRFEDAWQAHAGEDSRQQRTFAKNKGARLAVGGSGDAAERNRALFKSLDVQALLNQCGEAPAADQPFGQGPAERM